MKLSIVMMVKNESKYLEECLKSLDPIKKALPSEIIIVDTGSEDNTVEIAKKYTKHVYFHSWKDNFAEMRNITISYAKGEWVFVIDGDEILEDAQNLINFFENKTYKKFNTAVVSIKNFSSEKKDFNSIAYVSRLFRNKDFKYEGVIHEQPVIKPPVCYLDITLLHYGYISTDKELMERKFKRNTVLLKTEIERDPDNIYLWFQLSQSYGMYNSYKEALDAILRAYDIAKRENINLSNKMYIYVQLAYCYHYLKQPERLEQICQEALSINDKNLDICCFLAQAQQNLSKFDEAIESYERYLKIRANYKKYIDTTSVVYTIDSYEQIYVELSKILAHKKKYEEALEYACQIKSDNILRTAYGQIIESYVGLYKYKELHDFYLNRVQDLNGYKEGFTDALEVKITGMEEKEKYQLILLFSKQEDDYGLLNTVRLMNKNEATVEDSVILNKIKLFDFSQLPVYFAEILYYMLRQKMSLMNIASVLRDSTLTSYFSYLVNVYGEDFSKIVIESVKRSFPHTSRTASRLNKLLFRVILSIDKLNDQDHLALFKRYLLNGIEDIRKTYHADLIENEMVYDVRTDEDAFFIYMLRAEQLKREDQLAYIRYLKLALKTYPNMKRGIELLTMEITAEHEVSSEFAMHQNQIKEQINLLISNRNIDMARRLLAEYKEISEKDIAVYSMESMLAMIEEDWEEAERILKQGLFLEPQDFDLLCNAAYLLQTQNNYTQAIELYCLAVDRTEKEEYKQQIFETIDRLYGTLNGDKNVEKPSASSEDEALEDVKYQLKMRINEFIQQGKLETSKALITEYEQMVSQDIDIYSMKAMIAMIEGDYVQAKSILKEAEKLDRQNSDIFCNLGYLYEQIGNVQESLFYYRKAVGLTSDNQAINNIEDRISELSKRTEENTLAHNFNNIDYISEFRAHKLLLESNIRDMIGAGNIDDAKLVIDEYLKIVPNDLELLLWKTELLLG